MPRGHQVERSKNLNTIINLQNAIVLYLISYFDSENNWPKLSKVNFMK